MRMYGVWLNGRGLGDIPGVIVSGIEEQTPQWSVSASQNVKYYGSHVTASTLASLAVVVRFKIRERRSDRRAMTLDEINKWLGEGDLTVNYRANQFLHVVPTVLPTLGMASDWTEDIQMTFTAYGVPQWQDVNTTSMGGTALYGGDFDVRIHVPGTAKHTRASFVITARSAVDSIGLTCADTGTAIVLDGLGLKSGDSVNIYYDSSEYLHIEQGGESIMSKRSAQSSDDVLLLCGASNTVNVTCTGRVSVEVSARGRWM